jgi:phosphorylase/glycogen(starch) synthase
VKKAGTQQHALFEVSFEVCNKVGGIYTVLSTKAETLVERYGDDYVCIGPWLLRDDERWPVPFEKEHGFEVFEETCRAAGLPVQVGRWQIPGAPRTVLVEFSSLYEQKDGVLAGLWEDFGVDSLHGEWDYVEPVLFGHAAGRVIRLWWEEYFAPERQRAVAQFHEWMTGSGLLYLKPECPGIGTVFTTHATMLGRALSSLGRSPEDGLGDDTPEELAVENGVVAKHSLEGVCAREADVFTTVSEITAAEAELLHGRRPDPLTLNGIELAAIDALAGDTGREAARERIAGLTRAFVGEDMTDALLVATSGRYEFHNKGIDVLLDSAADLCAREGRRMVLFVLVPSGHSGLRAEVRERLESGADAPAGPLGIATHNLFDPAGDPVQQRCKELGLDNAAGSRVKVIQIPIYLSEHDDVLQLPYEAVLRAMDLSCFPSYYEPWGYTPQESLAVGVPTITTDYAGFGRWALDAELGVEDGVSVLRRGHCTYEDVRRDLGDALEVFLSEPPDAAKLAEICRATAQRTSWSDLLANYDLAFAAALEAVQGRLERGVPLVRRPKRAVPVGADSHAPQLTRFDVSATLPPELAPLAKIARNYAWCWDPEGVHLFEELSPALWQASGRSPTAFLRQVYREDLERHAKDKEYVAKVQRVAARLAAYLESEADRGAFAPITPEHPVAYFSAEYGIHESLRIYSGGLGVLSGDHLKSASDVGLPLIGVGLFYGKGYMTQRLTAEGDQLALDLDNEPRDLALEPVRTAEGEPLELRLRLPGREMFLRAWRARVGRVDLYLLDSDIETNLPEDRNITLNLYGGDETMRIRQEIVLGSGGARLVHELGIEPAVWHMNEGHAAFLGLERVASLIRHQNLTFDEAREVVRATTAFTTHTPVPAGHDRFSEDLMRTYFSDVSDWLGVPWERFLTLGRPPGRDADEASDFDMTRLALEFSSSVNGVSRIHGEVSRGLLHDSWPGLLESEVPVSSVTNGVHLPTWTRPSIARLVGADDRPVRGADFTAQAADVAVADLWSARRDATAEMLVKLGTNLQQSFVGRHDSPVLLKRIQDGLGEDALWIGFARRFAPYKRAHLIFTDHARLRALLDSTDRPVRLLIAGKAHPRDGRGKEILSEIAQLARSDEFAGRVIVAEDYDVELARAMVQGVDVWLNTPTRGKEASGTSGMKAAANGVLNLSIGDGWWPEGANDLNGWTIGDERAYDDQDLQDQLDAETLYRLLEEEVIPLYFERDADGVPAEWMARSRDALATLPAVFDTDRMVREYAAKAYLPRATEGFALRASGLAGARARAARKLRLRELFPKVRVTAATIADLTKVRVDDLIDVRVELDLGELAPEDVQVEFVLGHAREKTDLVRPAVTRLERGTDGAYEGAHRVEHSGTYAYGLRLSASADVGDSSDLRRDLVRWIG